MTPVERNRASVLTRWRARIAAGMCGQCGTKRRINKTRCAECRTNHRDDMRAKRGTLQAET